MNTDGQHIADDGPPSSDPPWIDDEDPADALTETEGVGGIPGLDPAERATVSDVDEDNVETEHPKPQI